MIAIDYKRKNIIVREFCLSIAYSVAGVLVLRNSHNHNIRGQYIWKNNKKKRQGKKQDKKLVEDFLVNLLLKRVHIWRWLCDRQPDEEKVRR